MNINKKELIELFFNEVCGKKYIMVGREPLYLSVYYKVTDKSAKLVFLPKQKLPQDDEKLGIEPIIEINNFELFKQRLYEYVEKFLQSNLRWTNPWYGDTVQDDIKIALINLWTNATWQDYSNPIGQIERYSSFLDDNSITQILKKEKEIYNQDNTSIIMKTENNDDEMETPYAFTLLAQDGEKKKQFPSVHYGIHNNEAYVYAIQGKGYISGRKNDYENDVLNHIRQVTKQEAKKDDYRGIEPLGTLALISFLETAKQSGIKKVHVPNFLPLRYNSKETLYGEEKSNTVQQAATNKLLLQFRRVMKFHSSGIKVLSVPGETGDFLSIDITDFKPKGEIIEKICENIDRSLKVKNSQLDEQR